MSKFQPGFTFKTLSPCKLNLFLYITGKRPDGYHNLQTLFTLLDYGDDMRFTLTDRPGVIELEDAFGFPVEQNTIYKAAQLLFKKAESLGHQPAMGVSIKTVKRIPQGGGLGGGSSNAATTLVVLNKLFGFDYEIEDLCDLAVNIGADVPVFTLGQSAFASGVGERLEPVSLPERWYLAAAPANCHVSTKDAFADPELKRDHPVRNFRALFALGPHNDFTAPVVKKHPEIGQLLAQLVKYGPAQMSGSGACCWAAFLNQAAAQQALTELQQHHRGPLFIARGLNYSPVHAAVLKL